MRESLYNRYLVIVGSVTDDCLKQKGTAGLSPFTNTGQGKYILQGTKTNNINKGIEGNHC